MSDHPREPVSIKSMRVHGPTFGLGVVSLVAAVFFGLGTISSGIVVPFMRSTPPDQTIVGKSQAAEGFSRGLILSMSPQTIYAAAIERGRPISTGLSFEQFLAEVELRATRAGMVSSRTVERTENTVLVSFRFESKYAKSETTFPNPIAHPKSHLHPQSMVVSFGSGPSPGTILIESVRIDGKIRNVGEAYVELIELGGVVPKLVLGQALTGKGLFEIRKLKGGVAAFLNGRMIYPVSSQPKPTQFSLPGFEPKEPEIQGPLSRRLTLQALQPGTAAIHDRLVLVDATTAGQACSAQAVVIDTKNGVILKVTQKLLQDKVNVSGSKDALFLDGFCLPVQSTASANLKTVASYQFKTGQLSWLAPIPKPTVALANSKWRQIPGVRIASPLVAGGGLVSVTCRPGGGTTFAVSGLPAPADLHAAAIRFASPSGLAVAQMRWRESARGYELDSGGRPNETRDVIAALQTSASVDISGAGGSFTIPGTGVGQLSQLAASCGTQPAIPATAKPNPPASAKSQ